MTTMSRRWRGTFAGSIVLVAIGLMTGHSAFLVAASFPLLFALYGSITSVPSMSNIEVEREFNPDSPRPSDPVQVRVTVRNTGTAAVPDLRVVDGVPEELVVTDGSPRAALALRPESNRSFDYIVRAPRGSYDFDEPTIRMRSVSADAYTTHEVRCAGDTQLDCALGVGETPLSTDTTPYTGTLTTDSPGEGLEFHSTRDYRYGDSIRRVDWRQYAKTGALTTIEYNQPETAEILLVVDSREAAQVAPYPGAPTGAELCSYAAEHLLSAFRGENHTVGLAILGLDDPTETDGGGDSGVGLIEPTNDTAILAQAAGLFETLSHGETPPEGLLRWLPETEHVTDDVKQLCGQLDSSTQVVFITPAVDDAADEVSSLFKTFGYQQTVLSPDIMAGQTQGQALADMERRLRLSSLTSSGIPVVDWPYDTPLEMVLSNHDRATQPSRAHQ